MSFRTKCPQCESSFNAEDEHEGKSGKCPKCGNRFQITRLNDSFDFSSIADTDSSKADYSRKPVEKLQWQKYFPIGGVAVLGLLVGYGVGRLHQTTTLPEPVATTSISQPIVAQVKEKPVVQPAPPVMQVQQKEEVHIAQEVAVNDPVQSWSLKRKLNSHQAKKISDVEVAIGCRFSTVYIPENNSEVSYMTSYGSCFPVVYIAENGIVCDPIGGHIPVNGKPEKVRLESIDSSIVQVFEDGSAKFLKNGTTEVRVWISEEFLSVGVEVVALPVLAGTPGQRGTSASEVIQLLGFPHQKKEHYIRWPDSKIIDGIFYSPSAGGGIAATHWEFEKYPGAVVSIVGNPTTGSVKTVSTK